MKKQILIFTALVMATTAYSAGYFIDKHPQSQANTYGRLVMLDTTGPLKPLFCLA